MLLLQSRVSSLTFRDEMLVVTSDFDGNVKFTIWKSGVLVRGSPGHRVTTRPLTTDLEFVSLVTVNGLVPVPLSAKMPRD